MKTATAVVLLLALSISPVLAQGEAVVIRNDSQVPVFVHVTAVFQGRTQQLRPFLLKPRMTAPNITLPGDKIVALYDAQVPTRNLYKNTIAPGTGVRTFSIRPDFQGTALTLVPVVPPR